MHSPRSTCSARGSRASLRGTCGSGARLTACRSAGPVTPPPPAAVHRRLQSGQYHMAVPAVRALSRPPCRNYGHLRPGVARQCVVAPRDAGDPLGAAAHRRAADAHAAVHTCVHLLPRLDSLPRVERVAPVSGRAMKSSDTRVSRANCAVGFTAGFRFMWTPNDSEVLRELWQLYAELRIPCG